MFVRHRKHYGCISEGFVHTFDETFRILLAASTIGVAALTISSAPSSCGLMVMVLREELRFTNTELACS